MRLFVAASATVALLAVSACRIGRAPHPRCADREGNRPAGLPPAEKADYAAVLARARLELKRLPKARADLLRTGGRGRRRAMALLHEPACARALLDARLQRALARGACGRGESP